MSFTFRHKRRIFSGEEFNRLLQSENLTLLKLFSKHELHNNYQYVNGINIDPMPFDPTDRCKPGGFYFFIEQEFGAGSIWLNITFKISHLRNIVIPEDATVYIEKGKCKSDKIILGERIEPEDYPGFREICDEICDEDGYLETVIPDVFIKKKNI